MSDDLNPGLDAQAAHDWQENDLPDNGQGAPESLRTYSVRRMVDGVTETIIIGADRAEVQDGTLLFYRVTTHYTLGKKLFEMPKMEEELELVAAFQTYEFFGLVEDDQPGGYSYGIQEDSVQ